MEYTHLGRTGLSVSRLCLGTMNFGPQTTEPDSHAIMDRAHEHGINFFDTANVYGWQAAARACTEQIVGRWFAQGGGRRERTVLATKLYGDDGRLAQRAASCPRSTSGAPATRRCSGCRPTTSTSTRCTTSTGTPRGTRSGRRWRSCAQQGKILYVGSSQLRRLAHRAGAGGRAAPRHFLGLVSEQSHLQPAEPARSSSRCCRPRSDYGLGVIPWSPLHGGLLGGVLRKEREGGRRLAGRAAGRPGGRTASQIEAYEDLCDELGEEPAHVGAGLAAAPGRR